MKTYSISSILISLGLHFFVVMDLSLESQSIITPELGSSKKSFNLNLGRKKNTPQAPVGDRKNPAFKKENKKKNIDESSSTTINSDSSAKTSIAVLNKYVPDYPYRSRLLAEEGVTIVEVTIDGRAKVLNSSVVKSSGFERLDFAALEASKKSVFNIENNKAGKIFTHKLEFNFQLKR